MPAPSLLDVSARLAAHRYRRVPAEGWMKKAAVAAVLRQGAPESGVEILLIRRAEHPRDPWSGHMAFPGGRVERRDVDPLAAAVRETREEIGLDLLARARRLGELSHLMAMAHGRPLPLVILPFVFAIDAAPEFTLNAEVQETLWVPLSFLADPANRSRLDWPIAGTLVRLPCYRYQGRVIWGLTLKMIDELLAAVARAA